MYKASPSQSFSSVSNASCSSSPSFSIDDGAITAAQNYLPAFLANRKPAHIGSIDLHFTKLPDGRCLYTYTVDWKENIKDAAAAVARKEESDFNEMLKLDRLDQISNPSSSRRQHRRSISSPAAAAAVVAKKVQTKEKSTSKSQQKLRSAPPTNTTAIPAPTAITNCCNKLLRRCDGPCNRRHDIHDLTIIGLCEHVACEQCLANAPRIEARFGGLGCPNVKCYLLDLASLCPDKKQRMETIRRAYALDSFKSPSNSAASTTSTYTYSASMSIETKK